MVTIVRAAQPLTEADLEEVRSHLRRLAGLRWSDPDEAEEAVQETLARLWSVRWRLERTAALGYAIVTLRNLATSADRAKAVAVRHGPSLSDPAEAASVDEPLLLAEEHTALRRAFGTLSDTDRRLLTAHVVEGRSTAKLAAEHGVSAGAVAARLARARAHLRVQYLLDFRGLAAVAPTCRSILEAISLGDRSRRQALGTDEHVTNCSTCRELAPALSRRDRSLAGVLLIPLLELLRRWWHWVHCHKAASALLGLLLVGGSTAGTAALAGRDDAAAPSAADAAVTSPRAPASTAPAPSPRSPTPLARSNPPPGQSADVGLYVRGRRIVPTDRPLRLGPLAGAAVAARQVPVGSVAADEGFWVGWEQRGLVWVSLRTPVESPQRVTAEHEVSFDRGRVVAGIPPQASELTAAERDRVSQQGGYVEVPLADLRLTDGS